MVEAMANSVEDYLINGISFKLSPGASYITDRKVRHVGVVERKVIFLVKAQG